MLRFAALALGLSTVWLHAQTVCGPTPAYSICDITFDLPGGIPPATELNAEFRGPSQRTFLLRAFPRGAHQLVVRFSPFEAGAWTVRLSSTLAQFHDKELQFTATPSASNGWIIPANVHHFRYTGGAPTANMTPAHLWVGDTLPETISPAELDSWIDARARAGVTHVRLQAPNTIDEAAFDALDARLDALARKGLIADLVLTPPPALQREDRQKFFEYLIARCSARNLTWVMLPQFESVPHAHELLREIAGYLNEDPFHHPRSVGAAVTSAPFADEKWMDVRSYGSPDWVVSAVEQQVYAKPAVALVQASSPEDFRHQLWNATMSGAYPEAVATTPETLRYLSIWQKLFADARHWDMEPYFDVDGARGMALPDTEYVLYVEHPRAITVNFDRKHKWNVAWINPISGEWLPEKNIKQEMYAGPPPDSSHDWILYVYREGHKESLKSYRFESRPILEQEVEADPAKVTFELVTPANIPAADPSEPSTPPMFTAKDNIPYSAKLKKETHASKQMIYEWTGEVTADDEGYRVLGTGASGTFQLPPNIAYRFPATLHIRLYGVNGLGKLYSLDQNVGITK